MGRDTGRSKFPTSRGITRNAHPRTASLFRWQFPLVLRSAVFRSPLSEGFTNGTRTILTSLLPLTALVSCLSLRTTLTRDCGAIATRARTVRTWSVSATAFALLFQRRAGGAAADAV